MTDILDDLAGYEATLPGLHPEAIPLPHWPDLPGPTIDHRGEIRHVYGGPWFAAGDVRLGSTGAPPPAQGHSDVRWFELLVPLV